MNINDSAVLNLLEDISEKMGQHDKQFESIQGVLNTFIESSSTWHLEHIKINHAALDMKRRISRIERALDLEEKI